MSKEGLIYGYKVHLIADYKADLPIALRVTPANMHENTMFKPLVKAARKKGVKASWVSGDAIHDSRGNESLFQGRRSEGLHRSQPQEGWQRQGEANV